MGKLVDVRGRPLAGVELDDAIRIAQTAARAAMHIAPGLGVIVLIFDGSGGVGAHAANIPPADVATKCEEFAAGIRDEIRGGA